MFGSRVLVFWLVLGSIMMFVSAEIVTLRVDDPFMISVDISTGFHGGTVTAGSLMFSKLYTDARMVGDEYGTILFAHDLFHGHNTSANLVNLGSYINITDRYHFDDPAQGGFTWASIHIAAGVPMILKNRTTSTFQPLEEAIPVLNNSQLVSNVPLRVESGDFVFGRVACLSQQRDVVFKLLVLDSTNQSVSFRVSLLQNKEPFELGAQTIGGVCILFGVIALICVCTSKTTKEEPSVASKIPYQDVMLGSSTPDQSEMPFSINRFAF